MPDNARNIRNAFRCEKLKPFPRSLGVKETDDGKPAKVL